MRAPSPLLYPALACAALALLLPDPADAGRRRGGGSGSPHEAVGFELYASPQVDPIALLEDGSRSLLFVANTTSDTVDVIDTATRAVIDQILVGKEPVTVAVKPGEQEVWVSCHVSDAVNVIDTNPASDSYLKVVEVIQEFDAGGATLFDEPSGIAFAQGGSKAYVALSSRDEVAVIDTASYAVTNRLALRAQEPRALRVASSGGGEYLYIASFESGNKSELSACATTFGNQCTLDINDLAQFAVDPNLAGPPAGQLKNIVNDNQVPDRDVAVYDTSTDTRVRTIQSVGTLLYGIAADDAGNVFVTQTDARNTVNGLDGANLIDLDNQMFVNAVTYIDCTAGGPSCNLTPTVKDLDGPNPSHGNALATPYAIQVSGDGSTVVATAAGSSRVFTLDASTLAVLGRLDLGSGADFGQQIPRGLVLRSNGAGAPETAWVLNTLENTVSEIDVTNPASPVEVAEIAVGADPTPQEVRRGRIAFNNAFASDTGSFSCASCHPDAHTDQLLWRIGGACFFGDCTGDDEPRSTMPIRGLKNTLPLHWDGTLGDPFGGANGAVGSAGAGGSDCTLGDADGDHDCFVDLVEESLGGVMCDQAKPGGCALGGDQLSAQEISDMGHFLASVVYPPARARRMDDTLSLLGEGVEISGNGQSQEVSALRGFADFFVDQNGGGNPDTCADSTAGCHELPLGAADNSATLEGFDAPTMRGMTDRFLQFSLGITNAEEILSFANAGFPQAGINPMEGPIQWSPGTGHREVTTFGAAFGIFETVYGTRPLDMFQMFEEASTGHSGALGRQVAMNSITTSAGQLAATEAILAELEQADLDGLVNLRGVGVRNGRLMIVSFRSDGTYREFSGATWNRAQLIAEAEPPMPTLSLVFTAQLRSGYGSEPQPLLTTDGVGSGTTGNPPLPQIGSGEPSDPPAFTVGASDVRVGAPVLLDGRPVGVTVGCSDGDSDGFCDGSTVTIDLASRPAAGLHLLQVQNGAGPVSNELPFCVGNKNDCD